MHRRILVATDGSACSQRAAEQAVALAKREGSTVGFLFVLDTLRNVHEGVTPDVQKTLSQDGQAILARMQGIASDAGVAADVELVEGDPADVILRRAMQVDLIVMGSHGKQPWKRIAFGSVSQAVLRRATRPLLLVHCTDALSAE